MNFLRRLFRREKPDLVRYYDGETKTVVRIPKAELRPGVVLVQAEGDAEPMYADASALKLGSVQHHAELPSEIRSDIAQLAADLEDVHPQSVADWEDGFRRDRDPARELAGWLHLAAILKVMTTRHRYDLPRRKECFRVLVACFTGDRATVKERSDPKLLPVSEVDQTIKYFFEGGYG